MAGGSGRRAAPDPPAETGAAEKAAPAAPSRAPSLAPTAAPFPAPAQPAAATPAAAAPRPNSSTAAPAAETNAANQPTANQPGVAEDQPAETGAAPSAALPPGPAPPFSDPAVAAAFDAFPPPERALLLTLRALIHRVAAEDPRIGPLTETLKWGQPAWLCPTGSTLRLGLPKAGGCAIYVHCRTTILEDVRPLLPQDLVFEGSRAIHLSPADPPAPEALRPLIHRALAYRLRRSRR